MSFEIRQLTSFPIEKLYYLLKLEVLEAMEPNDAIKFVKVNAGFRSILLRKPWIIFGPHVHEICFCRDRILVKKFPGSSFLELSLEAVSPVPLIKRFRSCDTLKIFWRDWHKGQFTDKHAKILSLLNSVRSLHLGVEKKNNDELLGFLENFRSMIGDKVDICVNVSLLKENQVLNELFKNFIVSQLNDCEEVGVDCDSAADFHFYRDIFASLSIKLLSIELFGKTDFEEIVQLIVQQQIPGKNLRAAFYVPGFCSPDGNDRIIDLLSQFPGMKRLDGEKLQEVSKITTEILKKTKRPHAPQLTDSVFFRRNIDARRDCVYMLLPRINGIMYITEFFACYVQPHLEIMEF